MVGMCWPFPLAVCFDYHYLGDMIILSLRSSLGCCLSKTKWELNGLTVLYILFVFVIEFVFCILL